MDLQNVFYIMAIIYMSIMFILMIVAVVAVVTIKKKINAIHDNIEKKLHMITNVASVGEDLLSKAKKAFGKK